MNQSAFRIQHLPLVVFAACIALAPGRAFSGDFVVIVNKANATVVDKPTVAKIYQRAS